MDVLRDFYLQLNGVTVFRNLLTSPVLARLNDLMANIGDPEPAVKLYAEFVSELYRNCDNFSEYIYNAVMDDENFYIRAKAKGENVGAVIENAAGNELVFLQGLSRLKSGDVKQLIKYDGFLPDWNTSELDFVSGYTERVKNVSHIGYGMFARHHMFTVLNGGIVPVKYPDPQALSGLTCYEQERKLVVENTLTLLNGGTASNALLYGDAGTGKSSTVKAIVNQYSDMGLRLVEVKKHQFHKLPDILEQLYDNPLKFIIFIDDLSFTENDDDFSALKALLEGSVYAKGKNVVIYATSNRRHLVRERHSDRAGDELHVNDTLQEIMGLAARFGLTVTFQRPDRDIYFQIVKGLADAYGLDVCEQFLQRAEAFAIRSNGRSPRTAKQFIEQESRLKALSF